MSTVGLNEEQIRKYVQWQEKLEKELEKTQLKMFQVKTSNRAPFRTFLYQATASGGGNLTLILNFA